MKKELVAYGVNVGKADNGDVTFERYTTTPSIGIAKQFFDILKQPNELRLWCAVEIEEIWELENGDYDYKVIYSADVDYNDSVMENVGYWKHQQALHPEVYEIAINADRTGEDHPVNICWLKLGYYSPSSDGGYFHYTSTESFEEQIKQVIHISDPSVTHQQIEGYLWWLEANAHLLSTDEHSKEIVIGQLARLLSSRR